MSIEIAGIRLDRIHKLSTLERATFVHHHIPGLAGNVVQNLGRDSVRLRLEGIFYGPTAAEDLEALREVYKARKPVDFLAEIVGQAYFGQITLERFDVSQSAEDPDQFSYLLTVVEFVAPPEPETAPSFFDVDQDILDQAQSFMDIATLPDTLGSIPEITDPFTPLSNALNEVQAATENLGAATAGLKAIFGITDT
jgi:DNA circularisation protein N-terminus